MQIEIPIKTAPDIYIWIVGSSSLGLTNSFIRNDSIKGWIDLKYKKHNMKNDIAVDTHYYIRLN